MCDEVGQASEQTATQLTLEDGVHLPQQHVLQLAGACEPKGGRGAVNICDFKKHKTVHCRVMFGKKKRINQSSTAR